MPTTVQVREKPRRFSRLFSQNDLDGNSQLVIVHNLNGWVSSALISDDSGSVILVDNIWIVDLNSVVIDMSSFVPLPGEYRVFVSI